MVHYTGDIHGDIKPVLSFIQTYDLTKDDTVVILGDAGLNYYLDEREVRKKKQLNSKNVTIFCVHGNHEARPETISSYIQKEWNGGLVYYEKAFPNLLFAIDGEIYNLDGRKTIVIGGAYSVDKYYRLMTGLKWFSDEQPSDEIKKRVEKMLDDCDWKIDQVLSHTCPYGKIPTEAFLSGVNQKEVDNSTEKWLDIIESKLCYERWLCGHWHIDKIYEKLHFLYKDIII